MSVTLPELQVKLTKMPTNLDRLDGIVNGPASGEGSEIVTDNATVKSVARLQDEIETAAASAETALAAVTAEGAAQILLVQGQGEDSVAAVEAQEATSIAAVEAQEASSITAVQGQQTTSVAAVASQQTTSVAAVVTQQGTSVTAVQSQQTTSVAAVVSQQGTSVAAVAAQGTTSVAAVVTQETTSIAAVAASTASLYAAAASPQQHNLSVARYDKERADGLRDTPAQQVLATAWTLTNVVRNADGSFTGQIGGTMVTTLTGALWVDPALTRYMYAVSTTGTDSFTLASQAHVSIAYDPAAVTGPITGMPGARKISWRNRQTNGTARGTTVTLTITFTAVDTIFEPEVYLTDSAYLPKVFRTFAEDVPVDPRPCWEEKFETHRRWRNRRRTSRANFETNINKAVNSVTGSGSTPGRYTPIANISTLAGLGNLTAGDVVGLWGEWDNQGFGSCLGTTTADLIIKAHRQGRRGWQWTGAKHKRLPRPRVNGDKDVTAQTWTHYSGTCWTTSVTVNSGTNLTPVDDTYSTMHVLRQQIDIMDTTPLAAERLMRQAVVATATGTLTFAGQPTAGDTVTINGHVITFVASGATGPQVNIAGTAALTAANLLTYINANQASTLASATRVTTVITLTATTAGAAGNAVTTTESSSNLSWGAATLTGGVDARDVCAATPDSSYFEFVSGSTYTLYLNPPDGLIPGTSAYRYRPVTTFAFLAWGQNVDRSGGALYDTFVSHFNAGLGIVNGGQNVEYDGCVFAHGPKHVTNIGGGSITNCFYYGRGYSVTNTLNIYHPDALGLSAFVRDVVIDSDMPGGPIYCHRGGTTFTASISGDVMTVTTVPAGGVLLLNGHVVRDTANNVAVGTYIVEQLTSTESGGTLGKRGTYRVTISQTVASTPNIGAGGNFFYIEVSGTSDVFERPALGALNPQHPIAIDQTENALIEFNHRHGYFSSFGENGSWSVPCNSICRYNLSTLASRNTSHKDKYENVVIVENASIDANNPGMKMQLLMEGHQVHHETVFARTVETTYGNSSPTADYRPIIYEVGSTAAQQQGQTPSCTHSLLVIDCPLSVSGVRIRVDSSAGQALLTDYNVIVNFTPGSMSSTVFGGASKNTWEEYLTSFAPNDANSYLFDCRGMAGGAANLFVDPDADDLRIRTDTELGRAVLAKMKELDAGASWTIGGRPQRLTADEYLTTLLDG